MIENISAESGEDFEQFKKQLHELINEAFEESARGNEVAATAKYSQIRKLVPAHNKLAKENLNRAILEKLTNDCSSAEDLEQSLSQLKEFFNFSDKEKLHFVAKSSVEKRQIMLSKAFDRVLDPNRHVMSSEESFEERLEKSYSPPYLRSAEMVTNPIFSFGEIAQPFVFSMLYLASVDKVENLLRSFPKYSDEPIQEKEYATKRAKHVAQGPFLVGKAASLLWSGSRGNNVPVKSWSEAHKVLGCGIGFALDPNKIDVLYGDFRATDSLSVLTPEIIADREQGKKDSKYKDKPQIKRAWGHSNNKKGITNYAKWLPSKNGEGSHYKLLEADAPSGLEVFAKNVWGKFFRKSNTQTNEMICVQKGEENPITGILLDVSELPAADNRDQVESNSHGPLHNFAEFLDQHRNLSLYVYDSRQEEHIVRILENRRAIEILHSLSNQGDVNCAFSVEEVRSLPPYSQFNSASDSVDKSFEGVRLKAATRLSDKKDRSGGCVVS